jgi:hypothetical protein
MMLYFSRLRLSWRKSDNTLGTKRDELIAILYRFYGFKLSYSVNHCRALVLGRMQCAISLCHLSKNLGLVPLTRCRIIGLAILSAASVAAFNEAKAVAKSVIAAGIGFAPGVGVVTRQDSEERGRVRIRPRRARLTT